MMTQKIKHLLIVTGLQFVLLFPIFVAQPAFALFSGGQNAACQGVTLGAGACNTTSGSTLNNTVKNVINILSTLVGLIAVIMIIINGLRIITSNGDSQTMASARNGIIFAAVGIFLVAAAQLIVHFAIAKATNH